MSHKVQSSPESNVTGELGFDNFIVLFNTLKWNNYIMKVLQNFFPHFTDLAHLK